MTYTRHLLFWYAAVSYPPEKSRRAAVTQCRCIASYTARVGAFTVYPHYFYTRLYNRSKRLYIAISHISRRLLASPVRLSHQKIKENTPAPVAAALPLYHVRMKMHHFCKTLFSHFTSLRFYGAFSVRKNGTLPPPTFKRTAQT